MPQTESTAIPLVGVNGNPGYSASDAEKGDRKWARRKHKWKQTKYDNVGERLHRRKELFRRRRNVSDVTFATALFGIILMIIHTELIIQDIYTNSSAGATVVKVLITLSTIDLLGMLVWFHYIDIRLYMIDNGMEDWLLAVGFQRGFFITMEMIICAVHPIPGDINLIWTSNNFGDSIEPQDIDVPLDVVLSIPMFLRVFLMFRVMLLHSRLFTDARSQSLGALNKTRFNFFFVFKSTMYMHPVYVMISIVASIFLLGAWAMRACESDHPVLHHSYWNALWLVAITFTSVGYGDIVPHTYCGRVISVSCGMLGAGCTALVVAVLASKLELSRAEKYVHNFVIDCELDKAHKEAAANILIFGWKVYRGKKRGESKSQLRVHQRKLLKAINEIRKTKDEQRRMVDSQVTILEVYKNQAFISSSVESIIAKQDELEESVEVMKNHVQHIGGKLEDLCRIMAARKDRRDKKSSLGDQHDLMEQE